jgi:hypothetical protein
MNIMLGICIYEFMKDMLGKTTTFFQDRGFRATAGMPRPQGKRNQRTKKNTK